MEKTIVIKLENVTKMYEIHHEKPTLLEKILNGNGQKFLALKNLNISIKKGEKIGLIGSNGSGKTTLLKIMAGITTPTSGSISVTGKVVSLIDLEAGFHPELTGIQNIFLNGSLLGMSKQEIKSSLKDIINFANIGKFIDAQVFTYSEGMKLRLGFSIAVHANPEILILDENISVGDENFQKISLDKIKSLLNQGKTVIIASHNMNFIKLNCKRVIWMNKGRITGDGDPKKIINKYLSTFSGK
jgi:ABC-type polysaccharide/polyol phosphate transport system ATPase subunit